MTSHEMPSKIEFIAWAQDGTVAYLPSAAALVRWAQRQHSAWMPVWRVDHDRCLIQKVALVDRARQWPNSSAVGWRLEDEAGGEIAMFERDPSDDPRTLMVVDYVEAFMTTVDGSLVPQRVDLSDWDPFAVEDTTRTWAPFGLLPPEATTLGNLTFRYCPELIAEQTRHLNDLEFCYYLSTFDVRVGLALAHSDRDPFERERLIESAVFDMAPEHSAMVNEVQMRVLDGRRA